MHIQHLADQADRPATIVVTDKGVSRSDSFAKHAAVDSPCQRNTFFNYLLRCFKLQCFSRPVVQLCRNLIQLLLRILGKTCLFGTKLSNQPIRILVRTALPEALWITEINFYSCVAGKLLVLGQLHSFVPSQ